MLRERTRNGLDAARREGRVGGRRPKLKERQEQEIVSLVRSGQKQAIHNGMLKLTPLKCFYGSIATQTP